MAFHFLILFYIFIAKSRKVLYDKNRYKAFLCISHTNPKVRHQKGNKMTYNTFLDMLEESVCLKLEKQEKIHRIEILKNNGVKLDGFSYQKEGHREQPTVYVNHYYHQDMEEQELEDIAKIIVKIQRDSILLPEKNLAQVLDYSKMKARIYYKLISREKNEELLRQVPWIPWLDLALVFYLRIPEQIVKNATALIHTSHMEHWGLTLGELYRTASENMKQLSVLLKPMEDFLEGYNLEAPNSGMYVLGTEKKEFGAAVIVRPEVQKMCRERLEEDYYVLPSSVHELILLPVSLAVGREELEQLVHEVNAACVGTEDYLGGRVYRYSSVLGRVKL